MWLITTQGFYSVVEDRDDSDRVLIRARARDDLEALKRQIPDLQIHETPPPEHDYGYRAFVTRDQWCEAAAQLAGEIDYDNFKNAVSDRHGRDREHLYHEVWHKLSELQRRASTT
jgi:hypothetical protein